MSMNLHRIACDILNIDDIALTSKQYSYLQSVIDSLPGIEQHSLESNTLEDYGADKDPMQARTIAKLRENETLTSILSISVMSYDSLVNLMIDIITGDYVNNTYTVESQDDEPETDVGNEDDGDCDAKDKPSCYLQALFGAKLANKESYHQENIYPQAICIFQTKYGEVEPYLFSKSLCRELNLAGIETNADLLRWYKEASKKPWTAGRHIGDPHIGKVQFRKIGDYINFWFNHEKQKLLSSVVPL